MIEIIKEIAWAAVGVALAWIFVTVMFCL